MGTQQWGSVLHQLRTILLLALAVCLNATFLLEHPHNSVVDFYPRWRWFHVQLERIGGAGTVLGLVTLPPGTYL
jgi:hypothetical protein